MLCNACYCLICLGGHVMPSRVPAPLATRFLLLPPFWPELPKSDHFLSLVDYDSVFCFSVISVEKENFLPIWFSISKLKLSISNSISMWFFSEISPLVENWPVLPLKSQLCPKKVWFHRFNQPKTAVLGGEQPWESWLLPARVAAVHFHWAKWGCINPSVSFVCITALLSHLLSDSWLASWC